MFASVRLGRKALFSFGLFILIFAGTSAFAASAGTNVWSSTFGQGWFYETRSGASELLAGTWWEPSLESGNTYRISFTVGSIRGRVGLLVGDNPEVIITSRGDYSYEFSVNARQRMVFRTRSEDVTAGISRIEVTRSWSAPSSSGGTASHTPRGHYLSFARHRDLRSELVQVIDQPQRAWSSFATTRAQQLDRAFRTAGVKGFWMSFNWGDVEVGDGVYDWRAIDANMAVARRYGLKMLVMIGDRSFDRSNIMPRYFPSRYVYWSQGHGNAGFVAKRWDPYVYNRLIRLYRHIANRYANHPAFGGIATSETALGSISAGDYTVAKYKSSLVQVATQTQSFLSRGKLFFYMNFIQDGQNLDMNKDARVDVLRRIPRHSIVVGGPDITPDVAGMPGSVNSYRVHARKRMPDLQQFCHLQHVDQGFRGLNLKTNRHRDEYRQRIATLRNRESRSWFDGRPGVYELDDLRDPQGRRVDRHPAWTVGQPWGLDELLDFGTRNYDCRYVIWHYREHPGWNEFGWDDVRPVILGNQYFYM